MANVKVIIVGKKRVGKTKLIKKIINPDSYTDMYRPTLTENFMIISMNTADSKTHDNYSFWDIAGAEGYSTTIAWYYNNAEIALLCFDPRDEDSFIKIKAEIAKLKKVAPNCRYILVETKCDFKTPKILTESQINEFKRDNKILFHVRTSAKENTDFAELTDAVHKATQKIIDTDNQLQSIAPGLQNPESTIRINWSFLLNAFIGLASVALCMAALATMSIVATPVTVALAVVGGVALLITAGMFGARHSGPDENPDDEDCLSMPWGAWSLSGEPKNP